MSARTYHRLTLRDVYSIHRCMMIHAFILWLNLTLCHLCHMFSLATLVTTEPRMLNWTLVSTLMLQFAVYRDRRPLPPKPAFLSSIEVEATIKGEPLCDTPIFCPLFFSSENAPIVFFSPNLLVNENTFLKGFSSCPVEHPSLIDPSDPRTSRVPSRRYLFGDNPRWSRRAGGCWMLTNTGSTGEISSYKNILRNDSVQVFRYFC